MSVSLSLRQVDALTCALRNAALAARVQGVDVASLGNKEIYVVLQANVAGHAKRVCAPLQQIVDLWLGESSLPAERIDQDIALHFVQDALRTHGLPSPWELFDWQGLIGFASDDDVHVPKIRLRSDALDLYLDELPQSLHTPPTVWPNLPVDTRWVLDTTRLDGAALTSLGAGDVICVTRAQGTLFAGAAPLFSFYIQDDFLMIEETQDDYSDAEINEDQPDTHDSAALKLDALPVTVSFVLGKRTMTVAEIGSLYPGMTIPLDYVTPHVDVLAGGIVCARGELVRIGETLGVEISKITPALSGEPVSSP